MPKKRDEESGQFERAISDREILELLDNTRLSTSEVADKIGYHRTTAYDRLVELEKKGSVKSKKAGNTFIWESICDT